MDSAIIVALIGGAVTMANVIFTAVFAVVKERRRVKSADEQNIENGLQCLLRAEIIRSHDKYMARCYCPIYAKENLTRAYNAYKALGGNDVATDLYHQCMSLPNELKDGNE